MGDCRLEVVVHCRTVGWDCGAVWCRGSFTCGAESREVPRGAGGHSPVECWSVVKWILTQTSKACLSPKKSHYRPKKSKFSLKSHKKINFFFFFFLDPFCYKNVDQMFYQPQ